MTGLARRLRSLSAFYGALLRVLEDGLGLGHGIIAGRLFRGSTVCPMGNGLGVGDSVQLLLGTWLSSVAMGLLVPLSALAAQLHYVTISLPRAQTGE